MDIRDAIKANNTAIEAIDLGQGLRFRKQRGACVT